MIGRSDSLIAASPSTRNLDADLAAAERRIDDAERAAAKARPMPTLPSREAARLRRAERHRALGAERAADLAAYSAARPDLPEPVEQRGPDGHPIIRHPAHTADPTTPPPPAA